MLGDPPCSKKEACVIIEWEGGGEGGGVSVRANLSRRNDLADIEEIATGKRNLYKKRQCRSP